MTTAIFARYLGPTNYRGSRVVAETADVNSQGKRERITVDWNPAHNSTRNYNDAAKALAVKLGWSGQWIAGGTDTGYVYVRTFAGEFAFEVEKPAGE